MPDSFTQIARKIDDAMLADRHRLRQLLRGVREAAKHNRPTADHLQRLQDRLNASVARHDLRKKHWAKPALVDELPIAARADEIRAAVASNRVVVIAGETGSGKSTQLPKILLGMGRGIAGMIGHTQPRRLAARSVATRIAEEIGSPLGHDVGYKVRFGDKTNPRTYIKLMTDGVLLAEASRDRFFDAYDTLIIDEAHERSLNIDFLLGHIKQVLPRRPDLRIIITSATIDTQRFAEHFLDSKGQPAPVIEVSGRTYPVEVRYRPPEVGEDASDAPLGRDDGIDALLGAADELMAEPLPSATSGGGGDVLVFMPTERDIREACDALEHRFSRGQRRVEVLPLFARLTQQEQDRIFKRSSAGRRIIVATNVAESSLTVPGIGFVIDTGTARVSRYAPNSKVQRLPIERVSQASANQRMGRCGRLGPGVCIRLYSEEDFLGRDEFSTPEVQRTSLASVILRITALGFGAIEDFPFVESPRASMIRDGYKTLDELGAIEVDSNTRGVRLTQVGRQLSRMPVDPRVARIVLAGAAEGCLDEVMVIAAAMEVADPRDRPIDKKGAADQAHAPFADERSDFLAYLKLWRFYHTQREKLSHNQLRKACKKNFLSYMRMREWVDVHRQLLRLVNESGLAKANAATVLRVRDDDEEVDEAMSDAIHRALLTGLLSNIACKREGFEYQGAGGLSLHLWPGSVLFRGKPQWVVAAELVETTRRYARTVGKIQPAMIEPIAGHLIKKTHSAPRWVPGSGSVMCDEKVSLYGLTIVPRRSVPFGKVDAKAAREMFIMHGLVEGDWPCGAPFFKHNAEQVEAVRTLEAKSRRSGLLCSEDKRYAFYDARLPGEVFDAARLNKWRKAAEREDPQVLFMSHADLMTHDASDVTPEAYPDALPGGDAKSHKLNYRFELGAADDGVTLNLPRAGLGKLDSRRVGWLVPGLLERRVEALIKTLPRTLRRPLSPAPDAARKAANQMDFGQGVFEEAAAQALSKIAGLQIRADDFGQSELPDHLRLNLRVIDEYGKEVEAGRDLAQIRKALGALTAPTQRFLGMDKTKWNAPGETSWGFGELPAVVDIEQAGEMVKAYPALIDLRESVALRLIDDRSAARRMTRLGLRRLFTLEAQRSLRWRADHWLNIDELRLWYAPFGRPRGLRDQLVGLMVERAFLFDKPKLTTREAFITRQREGHQRMDSAEAEVRRVATSALQSVQRARLALDRCSLPQDHYARADLRVQMKNLLGDGFLLRTPWNRLSSMPRYLEAVVKRIEKLGNGKPPAAVSDLAGFKLVAPHWNNYAHAATRLRELGEVDAELEEYRWLIEELRVSLFAQELGTNQKVSPQRLDKQWAKVRR